MLTSRAAEVETDDPANGDPVSEISQNKSSGTLRTRDRISEIISSGREFAMASMEGGRRKEEGLPLDARNKDFVPLSFKARANVTLVIAL